MNTEMVGIKRKAPPSTSSSLPLVTPSMAMPPLVALAFSPALMSRPVSCSSGMSALSNYQRSTNVLLSPSSTKRVKLISDCVPPPTTSSVTIEPILPVQIVELSEEDFNKRYLETDFLGEGGYGKVFKALDNRTQRSVIVKSFLRKDVLNWTDGIPTEIDIVRSLNHKNIAPMLDAFESNLNYRITMPDTNGMDMEKYHIPADINKLVPSFRFVVREIAQGLRYLHDDCQVVHLDIKPGNIIISKKGGEYQVQLIDFGCAKRYSKGEKKFIVDNGTEFYNCKERYTRTKIIGPEADIFSLGVFLHIMFFNEYPFETVKSLKSRFEVKLPKVMNAPENAAIRELIVNTLVKRPSSRWTASQVLYSDWVQERDLN